MRPPRILRPVLWPFAALYGAASSTRASLYHRGLLTQHRLPGITISVGNLTVGGTGKTPFVLLLAEHLLAEGKSVAILTRGYRSTTATDSDEVQLLARRLGHKVPIGAGPDRFASAQTLLRHSRPEYFLLDDGFQHLRLARDADIVLIDSTDPFGDAPLPAGRAREFRSALRRADAFIITRSETSPAIESILRRYSPAPAFYSQTQLDSIIPLHSTASDPAHDARRHRFFAFCAIGNPAQFFSDLRRWGLSLAGTRSFRDHHRFSPADVSDLVRLAESSGADALLCTEKDVFNLPPNSFHTAPAFYARIHLSLSDPSALKAALTVAIARHRAGTSA